MAERLEDVIGRALNIGADAVVDDLAFQSRAEWDSLNHITLMLALEDAYEVSIDDDQVVELTSVRAIRTYIAQREGGKRREA